MPSWSRNAPSACPRDYDADHKKLTVYVGSQIPYQDRDQIARAMSLPDEAVRVRGMLIGGGFGGKEDIAGQIHVALLAQGRPTPGQDALLRGRNRCCSIPSAMRPVIRIKTGAKRMAR